MIALRTLRPLARLTALCAGMLALALPTGPALALQKPGEVVATPAAGATASASSAPAEAGAPAGPDTTASALPGAPLHVAPAQMGQDGFPLPTGHVVDAAHLLDQAQADALAGKLTALEQQSGRQLVVVTVPSLNGNAIEDYGYRLGRAWGVGDKTQNNGALLIIAPTEHKVRIEIGYGLEGVLTDALSSVIINTQITPRFKAGDMAGGIEAGTNALIRQLQLPENEARKVAASAASQARARPASGPKFDAGTVVFLAIFFFFFVLPFLRAMSRGGGGRRRGGFPGVMILPGGGWGGGGGFGDGGGGGFGGFGGGGSDSFSGGGGSFGGGGASGSW